MVADIVDIKSAVKGADYAIDPVFESELIEQCCGSPRFWERIGCHLDPELMPTPGAALALKILRAYAAQHGHVPRHSTGMLQLLQSYREEGKVARGPVERYVRRAALDACDLRDMGELDRREEDMVNILVPLLQRRIGKLVVDTAYSDYVKRGDFGAVASLIATAKRLGVVDTRLGSRISSQQGRTMHLRQNPFLPTGVQELDAALGGGAQGYVCFMGTTGAGKSLMLTQLTAEAASRGFNVCFATLEINAEKTWARIVANLVDLPTNDILAHRDTRKRMDTRLQILEADGLLGFVSVLDFTSGVTTFEDITRWVELEEATYGLHIDLLVVDSLNDLVETDDIAHHLMQSRTSARMREYGKSRWMATCCQCDSAGMDSGKVKLLHTNHTAYSKGIPRAVDMFITMNPRDERELVFHVAKNRFGEGGAVIGPVPTDFAFGRTSIIQRAGWPF